MNVIGSSIARTAGQVVYTHAGPEIGVASTKAFTTQMTALYLLAVFLGRRRGTMDEVTARAHLEALVEVPGEIEKAIVTCDRETSVARWGSFTRESKAATDGSRERIISEPRSKKMKHLLRLSIALMLVVCGQTLCQADEEANRATVAALAEFLGAGA